MTERRRAPGGADRRAPARRQPARRQAARREPARREPPSRGRRPATRRPSRRRPRTLRLAPTERRLQIAAGLVCLLTAVVLGRLILLQGLDGTAYASAAADDRSRQQEVGAPRGQILDRSGHPLAYSVTANRVFADPQLITDPEGTARTLAGMLGVAASSLVTAMEADNRYQILAEQLDPAVGSRVMDLELPGIGVEDEPMRQYPAGAVGGQVVGLAGTDGGGLAGIEQTFDEVLSGTPGSRTYEVGSNGEVIPAAEASEVTAVPGQTVTLTLEQDIQFRLQQALDAACADPNTSNAEATILDVLTGQVVAIASCLGFDPSNPEATESTGLGAISGVVESGSVAKAITLSAALEEGVVTPDDLRLTPDSITRGPVTVNDAHPHDPINYTVTGIVAKSSNVGTLGIAEELGDARLEEYLRAFGMGAQTGIELPGESAGILVPSEDWNIAQSMNIPIGQGFAMTVLQMASVMQTIGNGGVRIPPRIVESTTAPDGTVTERPAPESHRVISEATAEQMAYMLEAVVGEGGTALNAAIDGYRVAGKTGTAQRPNPACNCYAGGGYWTTFAGFAPADAPRYAMSVMIERPDSSVPAGPIFAGVLTFVLAHEAIPPTGAPRPEFTLSVP